MAVEVKWFDVFRRLLTTGDAKLSTGSLALALCTAGYVFDAAHADYLVDITNTFDGQPGYPAGGLALTGVESWNAVSKLSEITLGAVLFEYAYAFSLTAKWAVLYRQGASTPFPGTLPVICAIDLEVDGPGFVPNGVDTLTIDFSPKFLEM